MEAQPFLLMKSLPPSSGAVIGICVPSIAPNVWGKANLFCHLIAISFASSGPDIQGRRIRGFEGARAPPEHAIAPSHCQKHPHKMKGNVMKHRFNLISCKFMVVLTFKLGLYPSKTAAIYRSVLNWTATSSKAPPRVSTILHLCWHCYVVTHANGDSLDELPQVSAIDHPPTIPSPQFQTRDLVVASSTFVAACEFDILNERQLILPLLHVAVVLFDTHCAISRLFATRIRCKAWKCLMMLLRCTL